MKIFLIPAILLQVVMRKMIKILLNLIKLMIYKDKYWYLKL